MSDTIYQYHVPILSFQFDVLSDEPIETESHDNQTDVMTEKQETRVRLVPTDLRKNKIYVRVYLTCMNFVVQILIPFTVLILLNFFTYRTIKASEQNLLQNYRYADTNSVITKHEKNLLPILYISLYGNF